MAYPPLEPQFYFDELGELVNIYILAPISRKDEPSDLTQDLNIINTGPLALMAASFEAFLQSSDRLD
ncbi:hypothetical protein N0V82_001926 [Gnomoniopsis sp. IMI 355080]|nr:hypothetical protein N0V82_001926 [Gnomoniopsis sp. IMI 355080]